MNNVVSWIEGWTGNGMYSALLFVPLAALVLVAAMRLVKFAEVIIVKTKFGGAFVGGVLIATVTSIPELISEISQASLGDSAASVANEIGSNAFSAFLIALTIVVMWKTPFLKNLGKWSRTSLFLSSIAALVLSIFMFTGADVAWGVPKLVIGIVPLLTFVFFLVCLGLQYKYGDDDEEAPENIPDVTVKGALLRMAFWSVLLIGFSLTMNWTVDVMMDAYGIQANSAGGIFLAFAGSLPEVVAFIVLVRKKRYVGATAALVGSHLFNLGITFFGDLAYQHPSDGIGSGAYYTNSGMSNVAPLAVLTGLMMLGLGIQSLIAKKGFKSNKTRLIIPSLVAVGYIVGWVLILVLV